MQHVPSEFDRAVSSLAEKSEDVFEVFLKTYESRLYRCAFSVCRDCETAQDLCQEALLKLWQLPPERFPSCGQSIWLYRMIQNIYIDGLRRQKLRNTGEEILSCIPDARSQAGFISVEEMDAYEKKTAGLPPDEQQIVAMKILCGMSHREIAKVLGKPVGTVQWKYNKALHSLRNSLSLFAAWAAAESVRFYQAQRTGGLFYSRSLSFILAAVFGVAFFYLISYMMKKIRS